MKFNAKMLAVAAIGMFLVAGTARADLISATGVTSSTSSSDASAASLLIDNLTTTWWVTDNGDNSGGYHEDYFSGGANPVLTFDLGNSYSVNSLRLWNYPLAANSVKTFSVSYSTDNANYTALSSSFTTTSPSVNDIRSAAGSVDTYEDFSFGSTAVTARYLQLTSTDNYYGGSFSGGDRVGLTEVKFATMTPEPTSLVLCATGLLGLLAYAWRKRKQA